MPPIRAPSNLTPGAPRNQTPTSPLNGNVRLDAIPASGTAAFFQNVNLVVNGRNVPAELVSVLPNPHNLPTRAVISRETRNGRHVVTVMPVGEHFTDVAPAVPVSPVPAPHTPLPSLPFSDRPAVGTQDVTVGEVFGFASSFYSPELATAVPTDHEWSLLKEVLNTEYPLFRAPNDMGDLTGNRRVAAMATSLALCRIRAAGMGLGDWSRMKEYFKLSEVERAGLRHLNENSQKRDPHGMLTREEDSLNWSVVSEVNHHRTVFGSKADTLHGYTKKSQQEIDRVSGEARKEWEEHQDAFFEYRTEVRPPPWDVKIRATWRDIDFDRMKLGESMLDSMAVQFAQGGRRTPEVDAMQTKVDHVLSAPYTTMTLEETPPTSALPLKNALLRVFGTLDDVTIQRAEGDRGFVAFRKEDGYFMHAAIIDPLGRLVVATQRPPPDP